MKDWELRREEYLAKLHDNYGFMNLRRELTASTYDAGRADVLKEAQVLVDALKEYANSTWDTPEETEYNIVGANEALEAWKKIVE